MLSRIRIDAKTAPKTIEYKITKGLLTIEDEEEACKNPYWAYYFARFIPGANIGKCCEGACKDSYYAYCFAKNIPGADVEKCRIACKGTEYAF